jgi:hypothetical protein
MPTTGRVTVTLPVELIKGMDHFGRNRSRFIAEAVEHELVRRRRDGLLRSLENPHPEAAELAEKGLADWGTSPPEGDEGLVDANGGTSVCKRSHQVVVRAHRSSPLHLQTSYTSCVRPGYEERAERSRSGTRARAARSALGLAAHGCSEGRLRAAVVKIVLSRRTTAPWLARHNRLPL